MVLSTVDSKMKTELILWTQLFQSDKREVSHKDIVDGRLIQKIFLEIDGRSPEENKAPGSVDTVKDRLTLWHDVTRNLRHYYLEVLQEVVTMRPPNIVLISRTPNSAQTSGEVDRVLLLLLCAAVRCDRRDHFIRQIMEHLSPDAQAGIMDCIKNFTESPRCVVSFDRIQSSPTDFLHVFRNVMDQLEDIYLEEIRDLLDQLNSVQSKFRTLQARLRLSKRPRAQSMGRVWSQDRCASTVCLGDPTRGELTVSTPKLNGSDLDAEDGRQSVVGRIADTMDDGSMDRGEEEEARADCETSMKVIPTGADEDESLTLDYLDSGMDPSTTVFDGDATYAALPLHTMDTMDCVYGDVEGHRHHHVSVELAETKAKLRRSRATMEDQLDQMNELHDQLADVRRELGQVKEDRVRLADAAHSARHWQDEVDALREVAERVQQLELENAKLKQKAHEVDYYKARCEQLTGDLALLSDSRSKEETQCLDDGSPASQKASLELQLKKARSQLAELEQLRHSDLDELLQLREELGRIRLEQCSSNRAQSKRPNSGLPPFRPIAQSGTNLRFSSDASDSEGQRDHSVGHRVSESDCPGLENLSTQLTESVAVRMDKLEAENRRLLRDLSESRRTTAANQAIHTAEMEARIAEFSRTNQLMTDKLQRLDTLTNAQTERIHDLEVEVTTTETETRKARESLNQFRESSDKHITELSKENNFLTESMRMLRGRANDTDSLDEQLARLKQENSALSDAAQSATTRLAKAELELSRLRGHEGELEEHRRLVDQLKSDRSQLGIDLDANHREVNALREVCQRLPELEAALASSEGECARLRSQLQSERAAAKCSADLEEELARLRHSVEQCTQLQEALQTSTEKMTQVEKERDNLSDKLLEISHNSASKLPFFSDHFARPLSDGEDADDDDEREGEDEEVDSGNKTGDSTEETSPDQFGLSRARRKTFNTTAAVNRFRDRRRRTRASLESETIRLEGELEKMEEENKTFRRQLGEIKAQSSLMDGSESMECKKSIKSQELDRIERLDEELIRLRTTLGSTEQELVRVRREMREAVHNPSSTEGGKTLVARISQLEVQLTKSSTTHQATLKLKGTQIKDLETERSEIFQQLTTERQTATALREQLVQTKIQVQQNVTILRRLEKSMQHLGLTEDDISTLMTAESSNQPSLEQLVRDIASQGRLMDGEVVCNGKAGDKSATPVASPASPHRVTYGPVAYSVHLDRKQKTNYKSAQLISKVQPPSKDPVTTPPCNDSGQVNELKSRVVQLEHNASEAHDQLITGQSQLAELIATNARLQVDNTTLHSQLDSLNTQQTRLSTNNTESEAETNQLRSMLESAHAAETHLTADYYHLQRLHEQLTSDYDTMSQTLADTKESFRRIKADWNTAQARITSLQSAANEVRSLREALEMERGTLKGEAKKSVVLREDCAKLHAQIESLTQSRDQERAEKTITSERTREIRQQLEASQDRVSRLQMELDSRRATDQKFQMEVNHLRAQIKNLTDANNHLDKENRSLLLQLQGLIGQNQELLSSTLESCTQRVTEEGALRERLLSLQRQKQQLEDKLMEQYRNFSSTKKHRRFNFVQKARAVLNKRKEQQPASTDSGGTLSRSVNPTLTEVRERTNSMRSQQSLSNGSATSLASPSVGSVRGTSTPPPPQHHRLIPGSVSIYDRDPDEFDTGEFQAFLRRLDKSSSIAQNNALTKSEKPTTRTGSLRQPIIPQPSSAGLLQEMKPHSPNTQVLRGARYPSGDSSNQSALLNSTTTRTGSIKSSDSPRQQLPTQRQFHFPYQQAVNGNSSTNSIHSLDEARSSGSSCAMANRGIPIDRDNTSSSDHLLPATDRCEKQLCEIITTKSTCGSQLIGSHGRQNSAISRSSSLHQFAANLNRSKPAANHEPSSTANTTRVAVNGTNLTRSMSIASPRNGTTGSGISDRKPNNTPASKLQVSSHFPNENPTRVNQTQTLNSRLPNMASPAVNCRSTTPETSMGLDVIGKPRVLLEYGDL